eukprot:PLAT5188.1.p1 GENE.PLAT5188.1~~PLAT5188.1.p1  ORF type:complete len:122 (+),score=19.98 PLAT5188.1:69-434(+)
MVDDLQSSEESAFVSEEIERLIIQSIESHIRHEEYDEEMVPQWINDICETLMKELSEQRKPFKYVVSCLIMQNTGAGVHSVTSCYWDTVTDGEKSVKWPSDKHKDVNKSLYCIVTVFGLGF